MTAWSAPSFFLINKIYTMEHTKCLIIGSGPAGYTAAIYAGRANLQPIEYCGLQMGGQLTQTTTVENFPGYPQGVDGNQMMMDLREQAGRFGADIRDGLVTKVDFSKAPYAVTLEDGTQVSADTVIIATGASAKYLGIPGEQELRGSGVSACATCDGFFYRKQDVAVIGGGDTACEEAVYLAGMCRKVYMIVRRDQMRASKAMQQKVASKENIEVLWNSLPKEVVGDLKGVSGIKIEDKISGDIRTVPVSGVFLAVGHHPNSEVFAPWVKTDKDGYIITEPDSPRTNIPGVFAAGDVMDVHYKQAITAAASGCRAAIEADRFLQGQ